MSESKNSQLTSLLSAPLSGIVEASSTHPLDRIKTDMQNLSLVSKKHTSFRSAVVHIYNSRGITGFYDGFVPRVIGIVPMRLVYWSTMNKINSEVNDSNKYIKMFLPGIVVGSVQTLIDNPIEVFKVRKMTGSTHTDISKIYRGFSACFPRNVLFAIPVAYFVGTYGKEHPFLSGAVGGIVGSVISQPLDVVKTEMQRHKSNNGNKSMIEILYKIGKENPLNLMSGWTMRALLGCVNMSIGFFVFNHINNFIYDTFY